MLRCARLTFVALVSILGVMPGTPGNRDANARSAKLSKATATSVPAQPSLVTVRGRQLLVRRRNPDGALAPAAPYVIRGVNWSPAGRTTATSPLDVNNVVVRRPEFGNWYQTDIPLLEAMNVNTVRLFMDPGLPGDAGLVVPGLTILDELYRSGIMAIVTVDNANNSVNRIEPVVEHYKNHPAVLMWSLGSEWNVNRFFWRFGTVDGAAEALESAAQLVKSLDAGHPVVSSYGSIVNKPNDIERYVTEVCPSVDVWSFNEYRGPGFSRLFDQWSFISGKPMFLGEFGIDAYDSTAGREDQATHARWVGQLWDEVARNLSARNAGRVALGGAVFEWNDEWWKAGHWSVQDPGGWNPIAFPDGAASEDWWGIVTIDRISRELYKVLKVKFSPTYQPPPPERTVTYRAVSRYPVLARLWENGALMYEGLGASLDGGRGFNIAAINPLTGRLRDPIQRFDTWLSRSTGTDMSDMVAYLDSVEAGTLLLIAVGDEAGLNDFNSCMKLGHMWVDDALERLENLGSARIQDYCYQEQWAMIARKGQGVALSEALGPDTANAATQATVLYPTVGVRANGVGGQLTLAPGDPLRITLFFDAGSMGVFDPAELYVGLVSSFGLFWLDPALGFVPVPTRVYAGPLPTFGPITLLDLPDSSLVPSGSYWWFMAIDDDANGVPNGDILDVVQTVVP